MSTVASNALKAARAMRALIAPGLLAVAHPPVPALPEHPGEHAHAVGAVAAIQNWLPVPVEPDRPAPLLRGVAALLGAAAVARRGRRRRRRGFQVIVDCQQLLEVAVLLAGTARYGVHVRGLVARAVVEGGPADWLHAALRVARVVHAGVDVPVVEVLVLVVEAEGVADLLAHHVLLLGRPHGVRVVHFCDALRDVAIRPDPDLRNAQPAVEAVGRVAHSDLAARGRAAPAGGLVLAAVLRG